MEDKLHKGPPVRVAHSESATVSTSPILQDMLPAGAALGSAILLEIHLNLLNVE